MIVDLINVKKNDVEFAFSFREADRILAFTDDEGLPNPDLSLAKPSAILMRSPT